MPFVEIKHDCRVMGLGFAPGDTPVEVDEAVSEALVKEKLAIVVDAPAAPVGGAPAGDPPKSDDPAANESKQAQLPLGNKEAESN